jgi:dihydrofolate synthase/folylpolyglutamate synthase
VKRTTDHALQLARLEARARYEPRPHSRPAAKLQPLRSLLERLGHPERGPRVVHVAGTNGKGTTATMVCRLLLGEGARVGLYTSPHLVDIRERIRIQGALVSREAFAAAAAAVLDMADRLPEGAALSYFDLLTAIGFVVFREHGVDWLVLETGLGGTADATNVTDKELCVLTPIGHDHMAVLGGDLRAVATQKMGIVPPGTPAVLSPQPPPIEHWMRETLAAQGSPLWPAERIALQAEDGPEGGVTACWPGAAPLFVPLAAHRATRPHLTCAAAALSALDRLMGDPAGAAARLARALTALETVLPGRQQLVEPAALDLRRLPRLVLDGAHNREALLALRETLEQWGVTDYTLLVTLMEDKWVEPVREPLAALLAEAHRVIGVTLPFARAPRPQALASELAGLMPPGRQGAVELADAETALALASETPERPMVATGSLYLVGELLKALRLPGPGLDPTLADPVPLHEPPSTGVASSPPPGSP